MILTVNLASLSLLSPANTHSLLCDLFLELHESKAK